MYQYQTSLYLPIFQEYQYWVDCTVTCLLRPIKRYHSLPSRFIRLNLQLYDNVYIHLLLMLFILVFLNNVVFHGIEITKVNRKRLSSLQNTISRKI